MTQSRPHQAIGRFWAALRRGGSFRLRLLLISVVIEVLMLTLLVANGARLIHQHLAANTEARLAAQEASFNITLSGLLASRDYASLQSVIDGWAGIKGITYMVVEDHAGRVVARVGRPPDAAIPAEDPQLPDDGVYNGAFDISFLGQRFGVAHYGLDTSFLGQARHELLQQSIGIAVTEVMLTLGLLSGVVFWLTRRLNQLSRASARVAAGDFSMRLAQSGDDGDGDEIGQVARAFNTMSDAVQSRLSQLQDSERRFRAIADYTYAWEMWFDPSGHLRWVNPAVERVTGYAADSFQDQMGFPLHLVTGDDQPLAEDMILRAKAGESGQDVELRIKRRNGEIIWTAASWQPIFDADGQPLGFRVSVRDISAQKRSADQLMETKTELEQLLYAASHDLREPIRQVLLYTQLLERQVGTALQADTRESFQAIKDGSRQMDLLVRGLADYSRSGKPMKDFIDVNCRQAVDDAIAALPPSDKALAARFSIGELPVIKGDPALLSLLFRNLLDNAVKYVAPGIQPEVKISAMRHGKGWRIDIADNGIGIEPEHLDTLIRPFSRLHARSDFPGAGLGLMSAMNVARIHHGRLWLDSQPGSGAVAHLWLPGG